MEGMIKITGVDLVKFVQRVYDLSKPQGLGLMHYEDGGLPEADAKAIIDREGDKGRIAARMDYVKGRACKMVVFREDGNLFIRPNWYDHSRSALEKLLGDFGIALPASAEDAA